MSIITTTKGIQSLANVDGAGAKHLPEPAITGTGRFRDYLTEAVSGVASTAASVVGGGALSSLTGNGSFAALIQTQIKAQNDLQQTTMISNVEKSKHESRMAAVRNIRVG